MSAASAPAPAVRVAHLDAGYLPGSAAIGGLEFEIEPGRTVAVLGPNGGGKTTLFRALLGEAPWRTGTVEVNGSVAYVPQTERARLDFPVERPRRGRDGNLLAAPVVPPRSVRRSGPTRRRRSPESGSRPRPARRSVDLSGGQRQRVLIARALAQGAAVILLDEPLSGVDQPSSERILAILGSLRDEGRAMLLSTHDIDQARALRLGPLPQRPADLVRAALGRALSRGARSRPTARS